MEPAQIVLLAVISVLTLLLVVVGIQVFLLIRDARRTLGKVNKTLDGKELLDFIFQRAGSALPEEGRSRLESLRERGRRFFRSGKPLTS